MQLEDLIGCWRLCEFVVVRPSGKRLHPFGSDAEGTLLYSKDGWVSAVLSRKERPVASRTTLETAPTMSDAAKVEAFDSYMSYTGRFEVRGSTVVHEVMQSLTPGLTGSTLERRAELANGTLTLCYEVEGKSGRSSYHLRWERP